MNEQKTADRDETLLTPNEAADRLRLHPQTVQRLCKRGVIPGKKVGGVWRIPLSYINDPAKN